MQAKEVSQLFGLSIDTLRYYERIGIIPPIARDKNGYRDYKTTDLNWIYLVKTLRKTGMPINALQKYTRLSQKASQVDAATEQKAILKAQLADINEKIEELAQAQALLRYKLDNFDEHLAKFNTKDHDDPTIERLWEQN